MSDHRIERPRGITLDAWLGDRGREVRSLLAAAAESLVRAGMILIAVKRETPHGGFQDWIRDEFPYSIRSAQKLMRTAEMFDRVGLLPEDAVGSQPTALYLLASSSATEEVRLDAAERMRTGETLTRAVVDSMISAAADRAVSFDLASSDEVTEIVAEFDVNPEITGVLNVIRTELPEEFESIRRTGHVQDENGEQIPLGEIGVRELENALDKQRREGRARFYSSDLGRGVRIVLDGERPRSLNKFYGRSHWADRNEWSQAVALLVRAEFGDLQMFENWDGVPMFNDSPVQITITAYMSGNLMDVDNIAVKPYIDGLKGLVIPDDSPRHFRKFSAMVWRDNERPRVEIDVRPWVDSLI